MSTVEDIEALYARGVTDGLPVVPPTRACVDAAVEASGRPADYVVARIAPGLGRATVEKIAVNAVMAGCRPEYMPVVIAAVQAIAEPATHPLHGAGPGRYKTWPASRGGDSAERSCQILNRSSLNHVVVSARKQSAGELAKDLKALFDPRIPGRAAAHA